LDYILADFFTCASGHPAPSLQGNYFKWYDWKLQRIGCSKIVSGEKGLIDMFFFKVCQVAFIYPANVSRSTSDETKSQFSTRPFLEKRLNLDRYFYQTMQRDGIGRISIALSACRST
jgi:hypothetical protein